MQKVKSGNLLWEKLFFQMTTDNSILAAKIKEYALHLSGQAQKIKDDYTGEVPFGLIGTQQTKERVAHDLLDILEGKK